VLGNIANISLHACQHGGAASNHRTPGL